MPEYTIAAVLAALGVVVFELWFLRTGLLRRPAYWVAMVIVFAFQVLVDGWLTKLSAPIVLYDDDQTTGVRFPWDIPVEDFVFGFALLTLVLLLWERGRAGPAGEPEERTPSKERTPSDGGGEPDGCGETVGRLDRDGRSDR